MVVWGLGFGIWNFVSGWPTGLEPATTRTTIWGSTIELWPPPESQILGFRFPIARQTPKPSELGTLFADSNAVVLLLSIASGVRRVILGACPRMTRLSSLLLAGLLFVVASAQAQSDDPSETFLKAYMTAQQGEKLERDNQFTRALAKYRLAGSLLEELKKSHSEWQPAIVEYRSRKVSESILRVQSKSGTQQDLAATNAPPAEAQPSPQQSTEPTVEVGPNKSKPSIIVQPAGQASPAPKTRDTVVEAAAPAPATNDTAIKNATRKLREKVEQLEAELHQSRSKVSEVEEEKEKLNSKLKESNSKLEQAQQELERTKGAEKNVRGQLADAQASLKKIQETGNADMKAQAALKGEIVQLKQALAAAEEGRATAEKERDSQNAKLADANSQIAKISKERDDALGQLTGLKDSQHRVAVLLAENTELKEKLATAEQTVREVSEDKPKKAQELADARKQLEDLRAQLAASEKQNKDFEVEVASLRSQLEDTSSQLEKAKLTGANAEETAKLTREQ